VNGGVKRDEGDLGTRGRGHVVDGGLNRVDGTCEHTGSHRLMGDIHDKNKHGGLGGADHILCGRDDVDGAIGELRSLETICPKSGGVQVGVVRVGGLVDKGAKVAAPASAILQPNHQGVYVGPTLFAPTTGTVVWAQKGFRNAPMGTAVWKASAEKLGKRFEVRLIIVGGTSKLWSMFATARAGPRMLGMPLGVGPRAMGWAERGGSMPDMGGGPDIPPAEGGGPRPTLMMEKPAFMPTIPLGCPGRGGPKS
jgi:hypothetical protein